METELTHEDIVTDNLAGDINDYLLVPGKYIVEFEIKEMTRKKWLKWLFPDRVIMYARKI
jgi:hypothetical protein